MTGLASHIDSIVATWVHGRVLDAAEQRAQTAVFRGLVVTAFGFLVVLPLLLLPIFIASSALAAGVVGCALSLLVAAVLGATGSRSAAALIALAAAAAAIALLAVSTGGALSPFMLWLGFLPLIAMLAGRTWYWLATGFATAFVTAVAVAVAGGSIGAGGSVTLAAMVPVAGLAAYAIARISVALEREGVAEDSGDEMPVPGHETYDLLAGLVTLHDAAGSVTAVYGADAERCREWLRQPMGRGFFQQIHVGDRLAFMQAIDELRQKRDRVAVDLRMTCASESAEQFIHLHVDMAAIRDVSGRLRAVLAQSRDVTPEVTARREAAEKIVAAESANAAKTRFLAAVSHELRTPLNAIIGFSEVLADERFGSFANDRQREYADLIHQSGGHLLSLVNTLLDMSRIEADRYELAVESFEVRDAVKACESMLALQARNKGVLLTSRVSRACGALTADRRAVDQILINLVANAIKFTEKGGVVTIDADMRDERVRLSVSDTGIGISAENLETLGQPFVQLHDGRAQGSEGSGLGLSLVKGLVALHGGGFTISSAVGEGTVVSVELARDGSGVASAQQAASECAVEFPPRLSGGGVATRQDMEGCDDAQARTA